MDQNSPKQRNQNFTCKSPFSKSRGILKNSRELDSECFSPMNHFELKKNMGIFSQGEEKRVKFGSKKFVCFYKKRRKRKQSKSFTLSNSELEIRKNENLVSHEKEKNGKRNQKNDNLRMKKIRSYVDRDFLDVKKRFRLVK